MTAAHAVQLLGILAMLAVAAANRRLGRQVDTLARKVDGLSNEVARLRGLVRSGKPRPAGGSPSSAGRSARRRPTSQTTAHAS